MPFEIKQEKFEGPLELLYELIKKEELAISEVSLAAVADEYLGYMRALDRVDPESLAGFLLIAAELMLIKSRALLPSLKFTEEEESSLDELKNRLHAYQRMRVFMQEIQTREKKGFRVYTREAYAGRDVIFYPPFGVDGVSLAAAWKALLASLPKFEKIVQEKMRRIVSLEERIAHIRASLAEKIERKFSEMIQSAKGRADVIVSFLAILELARAHLVELNQERLFEDIIIKKVP